MEDFLKKLSREWEPPPCKGGGLAGLSQREAKIRPWPGASRRRKTN